MPRSTPAAPQAAEQLDEILGKPEADRRRAAYSAAERAIRDRHRDEFARLYEQFCKSFKVPYKRKLTAAEKEAEQVREILGRRPDLHGMVGDLLSDFDEEAAVAATGLDNAGGGRGPEPDRA